MDWFDDIIFDNYYYGQLEEICDELTEKERKDLLFDVDDIDNYEEM